MKKIFLILFLFLFGFQVQAIDIRNYDAFGLSELKKKHIGKCSHSLFLHQNLRGIKAGEKFIRNGKYDWYTKAKVREAHILQKNLKRLGFYHGKIDGIIGPETTEAIKELQNSYGLTVDAFVGPMTRLVLANSCGPTVADVLDKYYEKAEFSQAQDFKINNEDKELSKKVYTKENNFSKNKKGSVKVNGKTKKNKKDDDIKFNLDFAYNLEDAEFKFDSNWNISNSFVELILRKINLPIFIFSQNSDWKNEFKGEFKDYTGYIKLKSIPKNILTFGNEKIKNAGIDLDLGQFENKWVSYAIANEDKKTAEFLWKIFFRNLKIEMEKDYGLYQKYPFIVLDKSSEKIDTFGNKIYDAKISISDLRQFLLKSKKYEYFKMGMQNISKIILENNLLNPKLVKFIEAQLPQEEFGEIMFIKPFLDFVKLKVVVKDGRMYQIQGNIYIDMVGKKNKKTKWNKDFYLKLNFEITDDFISNTKKVEIKKPESFIDFKKVIDKLNLD